MNVQLLTEIAKWLESGAAVHGSVNGFNMAAFMGKHHNCGTVCCIAGAAVLFQADTERRVWLPGALSIAFEARHILGLTEDQANALFFGEDQFTGVTQHLMLITPQWAARCIRRLLATGSVNWTITEYADQNG